MLRLHRRTVARAARHLLGEVAFRIDRVARSPQLAGAREAVREAVRPRRTRAHALGARAAAPRPWPHHELETLRRCPACGSAGRRPLYVSLTDRRRATAQGEWNVHRCSRCSAAYVDPRPTAASLMRDALPSRPPRPPGWLIARTRRLRVALRNGYVNRRTGQRLWPAHRLGYWWHAWRPRSRSRIHTELGWLPAGRQRRRLLDIGGQSPQAIGAARSSGWRVTVMLPDHRRPAWLDMRDVEVHVGSVAAVGLPQGSFDVINVRGGLERMHRPLEELEACARLLRPGGTLRISTPNLASLGHRHYRRRWSALDPPRSLVLFTAASLDRLLGVAGFHATPTREVSLGARQSFRDSEELDTRGWSSPSYWLRRASMELKALLADACTLLRPDWGERLVATARPVSSVVAVPVAA